MWPLNNDGVVKWFNAAGCKPVIRRSESYHRLNRFLFIKVVKKKIRYKPKYIILVKGFGVPISKEFC